MFRPKPNALIYFFVFATGFLVVDAASAQGTSLWQRRDVRMTNLVSDVKAHRAGDLLVVTINEQSDIQNKAKRTLNKTNSSSSDANGSFGLGGGLGVGAGNAGFDQDSAASRKFNADTGLKDEFGYEDRFTVVVVDEQANGNLIIRGERSVGLQGDTRKLVLTGIVRAADVSVDNVISSQMVADLKINYESEQGAEKKFINQGWLGRKFNRIWPH